MFINILGGIGLKVIFLTVNCLTESLMRVGIVLVSIGFGLNPIMISEHSIKV